MPFAVADLVFGTLFSRITTALPVFADDDSQFCNT